MSYYDKHNDVEADYTSSYCGCGCLILIASSIVVLLYYLFDTLFR